MSSLRKNSSEMKLDALNERLQEAVFSFQCQEFQSIGRTNKGLSKERKLLFTMNPVYGYGTQWEISRQSYDSPTRMENDWKSFSCRKMAPVKHVFRKKCRLLRVIAYTTTLIVLFVTGLLVVRNRPITITLNAVISRLVEKTDLLNNRQENLIQKSEY